jgi:hypothetical protein
LVENAVFGIRFQKEKEPSTMNYWSWTHYKLRVIIFILASVFFTTAGLAQHGITVGIKAGTELIATHDLRYGDNRSKTDVKPGYSLSLELITPIFIDLQAGVGTTYQLPRQQDIDFDSGKFNFIPIYALLNYRILSRTILNLHALVHAGYNIFSADRTYDAGGDLTGGFYWGAGVQIRHMQNIVIDMMYKQHNGTSAIRDFENDVRYSVLSLSFGILL